MIGRAFGALLALVTPARTPQHPTPAAARPDLDPRLLRASSSRRRWENPRYPIRHQGTRERTRRLRQSGFYNKADAIAREAA